MYDRVLRPKKQHKITGEKKSKNGKLLQIYFLIQKDLLFRVKSFFVCYIEIQDKILHNLFTINIIYIPRYP